MLTWRRRLTGTRFPAPPRRVALGLALLGVWVVFGIWLTFAFEWQLDNFFARMGLFGSPVRVNDSKYLETRYDPALVADGRRRAEEIGNVVLLVPGVLAAVLIRPGIPAWVLLVAAALVSTAIEVGQWVAGGRVAEVADIVVNTAGAAAAIVVVAVVRALWHRLRPPVAARSAPADSGR